MSANAVAALQYQQSLNFLHRQCKVLYRRSASGSLGNWVHLKAGAQGTISLERHKSQ